VTDNAVELADEAVVLRLIADALYVRAKDLGKRAAAAMGRGTLYPTLPDGTEVAKFVVPADAFTVTIDETQLLPWVRQHYPTEVMDAVRPAFIDRIRAACKEKKAAVGPGAELDIPGLSVSWEPKAPSVTATDAGRERAKAAVDEVLPDALGRFARAAITEGEK
jgi:hypothetical protein